MTKNSSGHTDQDPNWVFSMLESTFAGIIACDLKGTITYANNRAHEIRGVPYVIGTAMDQWLSNHKFLYIDRDERLADEDIPMFRALRNKETVRGFEVRIKRSETDLPIISLSANPLYWEGEMIGAMVSMVDITKVRRESEELSAQNRRLRESIIERTTILQDMNVALGRSQTRFRTIVEQSPFGIQIFNAKGKTILVNPAWKKIFNHPDEYIHQHIMQEYNVLEDSSLEEKGIAPLVKRAFSGETVTIPQTYYPHDGRWIESIMYPLKSQDGSVREIVLIHNDVTERHVIKEQRERFLATQKFLGELTDILLTSLDFETIVEQVATAAIPFFADGAFVDLLEGDEIKRIIARHRDLDTELAMKEMKEKFPPVLHSHQPTPRVIREGVPELLKDVDAKIIADRALNHEHADIVRKINIRSHIAVPLINRGEVIGAMNFLITTERPHYNEQDLVTSVEIARRAALAINNARLYRDAKAAVKLRDDFISIASHELKTPITALKLQQEVIVKSLGMTQTQCEDATFVINAAKNANRQLDRLTRLVEDMLDISRISTGKLAMNLQRINFSDLIMEVIDRFKHQLQRLHIDLMIPEMQDSPVICDPYRMEQVITNLMSNAIRYGEKKPITVSLTSDARELIFKIRDQGLGIAKEDQERIFNRFERAISFDISGLGLGLFISREIIKDHGGSLTVESEPGLGSTFTIRLSLDQNELPVK